MELCPLIKLSRFSLFTFICISNIYYNILKLDLFHAVQRVVKKISKRHPFSFNCAQAFSLILLQPHDHGESRKDSTPDPEMINKQLDKFVLTWKDVVY